MTRTQDHTAHKQAITTFSVIVLTLGVLQLAGVGWASAASSDYGDFPALHGSAAAVLNGEDIYFSGPATRNGNRNLNPPHAIWLMAPLGAMSLQSAALAAWAVMALAVAAFFLASTRAFHQPAVPTVFAVAVASAASSTAVSLINLGWLIAAGVAWAWIWARSGDTRKSAIAVGLLASVKVFFLIFVPYWLWRRNWRCLLWSGVAVAGTFAIGIIALGVSPYRTWLTVLRNESPAGELRSLLDVSLQSMWVRLPLSPDVHTVGWLGTVAIVVAGAWWRLRQNADTDRDWAIVLTTMLLVSPLGWIYYWLVPILPVAMVISTSGPRWAATVGSAGLLLPPVLIAAAASLFSDSIFTAAISSTYGLAALAVCYSLLRAPASFVRRGLSGPPL